MNTHTHTHGQFSGGNDGCRVTFGAVTHGGHRESFWTATTAGAGKGFRRHRGIDDDGNGDDDDDMDEVYDVSGFPDVDF